MVCSRIKNALSAQNWFTQKANGAELVEALMTDVSIWGAKWYCVINHGGADSCPRACYADHYQTVDDMPPRLQCQYQLTHFLGFVGEFHHPPQIFNEQVSHHKLQLSQGDKSSPLATVRQLTSPDSDLSSEGMSCSGQLIATSSNVTLWRKERVCVDRFHLPWSLWIVVLRR